jgi:putative MATE family efflux protein
LKDSPPSDYGVARILSLSYPILLSLLAQNIINVTDTAFLSRVGNIELGASVMGGLCYICAFTVAFGFSVGAQILMARRNGEQSYAGIGSIMFQGCFFLLGMALVIFTILRAGSGVLMQGLVSNDEIRDATQRFLNIRCMGFFFSFINVMFRAFYVAIARTKILTANAIVMASLNIVLDWALIFGRAGMPAMGIEGAAIASVAADAGSTIFFIVYTAFTMDVKKYGLNRPGSFNLPMLGRILRISIFTMMQQFITMLSFLCFFIVVERLGSKELAVGNITRSIYIVFFIPINALSTVTGSLVSNAIGAGRSVMAMSIIRRTALMSLSVSLVISAIFVLFPQAILGIYTSDPGMIEAAIPSIRVICAVMILSSAAAVCFNGVSGTGNTNHALLIELAVMVFYCVYVYIIGIEMRMPVHICFTSEILYWGLTLLFCILYFKTGIWKGKKI